jgi:hypothetical protein
MSLPFTIDGTQIPPDAPRSMMTDAQAQAVSDAAETYRALVMHLHADVVGSTVTLTGANCPDGTVVFTFGDGAADVEERATGGTTPEVTHTYLTDGVFTAQLVHEYGERADLEIAVNWPPYEEQQP